MGAGAAFACVAWASEEQGACTGKEQLAVRPLATLRSAAQRCLPALPHTWGLASRAVREGQLLAEAVVRESVHWAEVGWLFWSKP